MLIDTEVNALAERIMAAADARLSIAPVTDGRPEFGLADAYRTAVAVTRLRLARGERPVGWKIGFTNRGMWDDYGVHAPIWAPVYDRTVVEVTAGPAPAGCAIGHLVEPRIEPEIVLRLARRPEPGMDETELLGCVDAVAHGYEIVHSLFPGWRFRAADTVAAFGLHGLLCHGPFVPVDGRTSTDAWRTALEGFTITLARDGDEVELGRAGIVLGGPLSALRHFVDAAATGPEGWRPDAGDVVTTGTLTRPYPIRPGERWTTRLDGLDLPGMDVLFAE